MHRLRTPSLYGRKCAAPRVGLWRDMPAPHRCGVRALPSACWAGPAFGMRAGARLCRRPIGPGPAKLSLCRSRDAGGGAGAGLVDRVRRRSAQRADPRRRRQQSRPAHRHGAGRRIRRHPHRGRDPGLPADRLWPQRQPPAHQRASWHPISARRQPDQLDLQLVLSASWEIDLWGRIRRETEAARANLLSTAEARRGVVLTLVASVISGYVTLLDLDSRLQVAEETLAGRQRIRLLVPQAARRRLHLRLRNVAGPGRI